MLAEGLTEPRIRTKNSQTKVLGSSLKKKGSDLVTQGKQSHNDGQYYLLVY